MNMKETIQNVLSLKNESSMWEKFNNTVLHKETHFLKEICSETEDIFAFVEGDEICVLMADRALQITELADECPFAGSLPLYFNENSYRVSPVYRLYCITEALRQYPQLQNADISGVLLTTSDICNVEDMEEIWENLGITVRCVKNMRYTISLKSKSQFWNSVSDYLGKIPLEKYVDLSSYESLVETSETSPDAFPEVSQNDQASCASTECTTAQNDNVKNKHMELRLEDIIDKNDPIFQTLGADGTTSFVSANLPPVRVFPPMENAMEYLEKMVGLDEIKKHITTLKNFVLFKDKLRDFPEITSPEISLHSIFKGAPGTGKTSVALLYASVLKEAGILSKGNLLLANGRNAFTGKWVGTEEKNMRMALAAAKGNVLMIDEAYTLASPNEMDYIRNVLPMMLQILADEEYRDIAVVLCGYDHEMEFMLNSNPGLRSRFPNVFYFKDYSVAELYEMALNKLTRNGYKVSDEAAGKISEVLADMYKNREHDQWANGREVTNLFDRILVAHANRCISSGAEGEMLITITAEDIPEKANVANSARKTGRIGFN